MYKPIIELLKRQKLLAGAPDQRHSTRDNQSLVLPPREKSIKILDPNEQAALSNMVMSSNQSIFSNTSSAGLNPPPPPDQRELRRRFVFSETLMFLKLTFFVTKESYINHFMYCLPVNWRKLCSAAVIHLF